MEQNLMMTGGEWLAATSAARLKELPSSGPPAIGPCGLNGFGIVHGPVVSFAHRLARGEAGKDILDGWAAGRGDRLRSWIWNEK